MVLIYSFFNPEFFKKNTAITKNTSNLDYWSYGISGFLFIGLCFCGYYIYKLRKQLNNYQPPNFITEPLTERDKKKIVEQVTQNITDNSNKDLQKKERFDTISENINYSKTRLEKEINSLNNKAKSNLTIGIIATSFVIAILIYNIHNNTISDFENVSLNQFLYYFIPRFSLMIFIELFAYYFLSLYKTNTNEVKFYQSELTDLEYKSMVLKIALKSDSEEDLAFINKELLKIDKNRVLRKGETTTELERYRIDQNMAKEFMPNYSMFAEFVKKFTEKAKDEADNKDKK